MIEREYQRGDHVVMIIVIVAVAIIGLLGWVFWQNFVNQPNDTANQDDINAAITVSRIEKQLLVLPRITDRTSIDEIVIKLDDPAGVKLTVDKADIHVTYLSSQRTEYGALDKAAVTEILRSAGLSQYQVIDSQTVVWMSDGVICVVGDSEGGWAGVSCSTREAIDTARSELAGAVSEVRAHYPSAFVTQAQFYKSNSAMGFWFYLDQNTNTHEDDPFDAYLAKTYGGQWEYLASSTRGLQSPVLPSCSLVVKAPYGNVFNLVECD